MTPRMYDDETTQKEIHGQIQGQGSAGGFAWRKDASQLAEQFEVHANQISQWRQQAIENMAGVFGKEQGSGTPDHEVKELHAKIGELLVEKDFLQGALSKAGLPSGKR